MATSFTTLLALVDLLFAIFTSNPETFVNSDAHKKLVWLLIFHRVQFLWSHLFVCEVEVPLYIWVGLFLT